MNATRGPIAGRLKRPTWRDPRLLVGLVLIADSVMAVVSIVRSADVTERYYAARDTITPGTVLDEGHLVIVNVRVGSGTYVAADGVAPWGSVVTRVVGQGELLPTQSVIDIADFEARPVAIQTSLPLAAGIDRGAIVDVWLTSEGELGPQSTLIAEGLVVDQVERGGGAFAVRGAETVYVVVPARQMAEFLDAIATDGDISVVGLAGSGAK